MAAVARPRRSAAVEDYTKAIYVLGQEIDGPVTITALADRLGVTAPSASAMVKKLHDPGLAEHVPYKGVALTSAGERLAHEISRHHRLLETFLAEHLDVPRDRAHAEADVLEHVLSDYLEERIATKLGHPTRDLDGDPIPETRLEI